MHKYPRPLLPVQAGAASKWYVEGSHYLGKRIERTFQSTSRKGTRTRTKQPDLVVKATVVGWLPAEANGGSALWHVRHDDGDEEDLDEIEVGLCLSPTLYEQYDTFMESDCLLLWIYFCRSVIHNRYQM